MRLIREYADELFALGFVLAVTGIPAICGMVYLTFFIQ